MSETLPYGYTETSPFGGSERTSENIDVRTGNISATRFFIGPWEDRHDFVWEYLLGSNSPGSYLTVRRASKSYPDIKGLYVSNVQITAEGTGEYDELEEKTIWQRARITVEYSREVSSQSSSGGTSQDDENLFNGIYTEESVDSHGELVTIPGKDLADDGGKNLNDKGPFHKKLIYATIILKTKAIIVPPWFTAMNLLGRINGNVFITPSGIICPIGTLRYEGPSGYTKVNILDRSGLFEEEAFPLPVWEISHKFEFNRWGWNNAFIDGVWKAIVPALHEFGDLFALFMGDVPGNILQILLQIQDLYDIIQVLLDAGTPFNDPLIINRLNEIQILKQQMGFRV